jgi:hypothetical protein
VRKIPVFLSFSPVSQRLEDGQTFKYHRAKVEEVVVIHKEEDSERQERNVQL